MSGHKLAYERATETNEIPDPGDAGVLQLDRDGAIYIIESAGAETRTIASPQKVGVRLGIMFKTDGGNVTITGSGSETIFDGTSAHTTITLSTARDYIEIMSAYDADDIEWVLVANSGAGLS